MPSKRPKELWSAPPHTLAKLEILSNYLNAYFRILGSRTLPTREILYVDGFAGPNEYLDHPRGSPSVAVTAAVDAICRAGDEWRAKGVNCVFIEKERWIAEHCRQKLAELPVFERVKHNVLLGSFDQVLPALMSRFPAHFHDDAPLFVFADPFGPTGVPFDSIRQILAADCSELFLNFDSDGVIRIVKAQREGNTDTNLTRVFGDESWRGQLDQGGDALLLARKALKLFKKRLHSISGVNYVFAFEMQKHLGNPDYHLVFAGKHRLGLEKMKEAMRAIAKHQGGFEFCDASAFTGSLFRFDRPDDWAATVHSQFAGHTVEAARVWDFVLNETLLVNAKGVLETLEKSGHVRIDRHAGVGMKRDLPSMRSIAFTAGAYVPPVILDNQRGLFDGT